MSVNVVKVQGTHRVLDARRSVPGDSEKFLPRKGFSIAHVPVVDLSSKGPAIYDQGSRGACTAHGWMRAFEYNQLADQRAKIAANGDGFQFDVGTYVAASRRYFYRKETEVEGTPGEDNGAQITTGGKVLAEFGVPPEKEWPYDPDNDDFLANIPDEVETLARPHIEPNSYRLMDLAHIKESLQDGFVVPCGLSLYDSFMGDQVAETGIVPMPSQYENYAGGHCVCIVGYDDTKQLLLVANSWGTGWGKKGYFYLPYKYAQNPNLFFDPMTLRPKGFKAPVAA